MTLSYPAKLLLFGEYAVIAGGEGLAVPYYEYNTVWVSGSGNKEQLYDLRPFYNYLNSNTELKNILKLDRFDADLKNNYFLRSNIPVGAGLGSSGSVVAAIYDKYAVNNIARNKDPDLILLRSQLGQMENFYHEKSSGLDPLVILLNQPLHLLPEGKLMTIENEIPLLKEIGLNLFNTEIDRKASTLITIFNDKMKDKVFQNTIYNKYLPLVSTCISSLLENNRTDFFDNLHRLSVFQLEHFAFAIPESIRPRWAIGLRTEQEIFKLCGAGGGGYMFCFNAQSTQ